MSQPNPWNSVPATQQTDPPVRKKLARMRPETESRLIEWATRQPAGRDWLMRRTMAYWDAFEKPLGDGGNRQIEATVALDLLQWQTGIESDRIAVEQLKGFEGVAA